MSNASLAQLKVSQGSRILASQKVLDAFGHVSMRSQADPALFYISRNRAPALVAPEDVVTVDLDGHAVSQPADVRLFLERYIHAEIYRRRPDVHAVVHSHALPVLPFTVIPGKRLRPICHMCGFIEGAPEAFDVADHAGSATDLLIGNAHLGQKLAEHLGDANIVLMRSHGFTAVGASVEQAVYRAIYTMKNCEIELSARTLGDPVYLSPGEAEACERTIGTQTNRAWDLWLDQLRN